MKVVLFALIALFSSSGHSASIEVSANARAAVDNVEGQVLKISSPKVFWAVNREPGEILSLPLGCNADDIQSDEISVYQPNADKHTVDLPAGLMFRVLKTTLKASAINNMNVCSYYEIKIQPLSKDKKPQGEPVVLFLKKFETPSEKIDLPFANKDSAPANEVSRIARGNT